MATHRAVLVFRVVLPIIVFGLIGVLARNYWVRLHRIPPRNNALARRLAQNTSAVIDGATKTITINGKTVYSITAKTITEYTDHKTLFTNGVEVTVHGRQEGEPTRHVRGDQCTYDDQTQDIRFEKNVTAQLDEKTFVHTEELTYTHDDNLVQSNVLTEFEQPDVMTGAADRFKYDVNSGLLRLDGNVHMELTDGQVLKGGAIVFQSKENWAEVSQGVYLQSMTGWVRGNKGRAELMPMTYHPTSMVVDGDVSAESNPPNSSDNWKLRSDWMQAAMSAKTGNIEHVLARGSVRVDKMSENSTEVLTGAEVEAAVDEHGRVSDAEARRNARIEGSDRTLKAEKIHTDAANKVTTDGKSILQTNDSVLEGSNFVIDQNRNKVTTDGPSVLRTPDYNIQGRNFTIERGEFTVFTTPFRSDFVSGERKSSADSTHAEFTPKDNKLKRLIQTGHFEFTEGERHGKASKAEVTDDGDTIDLDGAPKATVSDSQMNIEGQHIRLIQKTNAFVANGEVRTISAAQGDKSIAKAPHAEGNGDNFHYTGGVDFWRGDSHIKADTIEGSSKDDTFHAQGNVRSDMQSQTGERFTANAQKLDYTSKSGSDIQTAHYTGKVQAEKRDPRGNMNLKSEDLTLDINQGTVQTAHAVGGVDMKQGLRHGVGDEAFYDTKTDAVTLTGKDAVATDPKQGTVRGTRLLSRNGGDIVVLEGDPAGRATSTFKVNQK
jgi:LPS export ABC transporter protein LptC